MEISNLIGKTLKKPPAREYIDSFKMLIRGGFVKVLEDNSFVFTSTLNGSIEKLYSLIIKHFHDYNVVSIYPKFSSDSLFDFLNSEISSYKQLPLRIRYQTIGENKKYYMKLGLLYPQNSLILGFSLIMSGKDEIELEQKKLEDKLFDFFNSMNLKTEKYLSAKHNRNVNDNVQSYDFSILSDLGKHEFVICTKCEYKATRDVAVVHKSASDVESEADLSEVHTPESKTIAQLAQLLGIAESKCAKAVFYSYSNQNGSKLVLVIIRGDIEVNEFKVKQLLNVGILKVATDIEIEKVGGVPGFASAISINRELCTVIVDELIPKSKNLVAGANKVDYHLLNTNYDRDYNADIVSDVALATESGNCSNCQASLEIKLGIPICQLTVDRENKSVAYLDDKGKPSIGSVINFEFDLTRILGALSLDFDKFGVKFPIQISPFQIVLITIGSEPEVMELGDKLHEELNWHFDILYDNRDVKLGVKLNDTDLRSIPFRLIISKRSIEVNEIEFSKRGSKDKRYFKLEKVLVELEQIKEVSMYKGI